MSSPLYRKILSGHCGDIGFQPITEKVKCEEAARYLGLADAFAQDMNLPDKPEGCYYFRNLQDLTSTLWINYCPGSRGKGAETSDTAKGGFRQPLCMIRGAQAPTTITTTAVVQLTGARNNLKTSLPQSSN